MEMRNIYIERGIYKRDVIHKGELQEKQVNTPRKVYLHKANSTEKGITHGEYLQTENIYKKGGTHREIKLGGETHDHPKKNGDEGDRYTKRNLYMEG